MAKVGIIGGSGLGDALGAEINGREETVDTPFGDPSSPIVELELHGTDVAVLQRHGIGHMIPPGKVNYRANLYAMKMVGCTHIIASGAVGSLREDVEPKHLVIADQVIDKTFRRMPTFFDDLAVHLEFSSPFCPILRKHLLSCSDAVDTVVHSGGTYVCMEGPAFSTRAESEMHRSWGGDLIGMTVMPEAKLAREAEMSYALVALPSDYDCWRPAPDDLDKHELLKEIIGTPQAATANAIALIKRALETFPAISETPSPAHNALEMAIWSDKAKIPAETKEKLKLLIGRYVDE